MADEVLTDVPSSAPPAGPIANDSLLSFLDETLRPLAGQINRLLLAAQQILDAAKGRGYAELIGTTPADLFRSSSWTDAEYAATGAPRLIAGSDSNKRYPLTHHDIIGLLRVVALLKSTADAHPELGPLLAKLSENPRV